MNLLTAMIVASTVASALIGGVFFAFSVFVVRALTDLPPAQGILAMQRVNITVINPLFLGVFFGTALLLGVTTYFGRYSPQSFAWLIGAFLIYLVGSVGVTMALNVPRNNRLASLEATSAEAAAYWPVYVREWLTWNHVRCIASLAAAVVAMLAVAS
ncbi:MAG: DUF1772 domain-containing protein [Burkholderiaceae bacterium]|nr:DUF1772 domain-containing protein [Burkholderiaceae bacterium]